MEIGEDVARTVGVGRYWVRDTAHVLAGDVTQSVAGTEHDVDVARWPGVDAQSVADGVAAGVVPGVGWTGGDRNRFARIRGEIDRNAAAGGAQSDWSAARKSIVEVRRIPCHRSVGLPEVGQRRERVDRNFPEG